MFASKKKLENIIQHSLWIIVFEIKKKVGCKSTIICYDMSIEVKTMMKLDIWHDFCYFIVVQIILIDLETFHNNVFIIIIYTME